MNWSDGNWTVVESNLDCTQITESKGVLQRVFDFIFYALNPDLKPK